MRSIAVLVSHRTQPGQRDAVRVVWERHMAPAVAENPGHLSYFYTFDVTDPDVIHAFQHYRSPEDAAAFLETAQYQVYERDVAPLLVSTVVTPLSPMWTKEPDSTTSA